MIRRILFLGLLVYGTSLVLRARAERAEDTGRDETARADWDSEGGSPPPDPVDTPLTV